MQAEAAHAFLSPPLTLVQCSLQRCLGCFNYCCNSGVLEHPVQYQLNALGSLRMVKCSTITKLSYSCFQSFCGYSPLLIRCIRRLVSTMSRSYSINFRSAYSAVKNLEFIWECRHVSPICKCSQIFPFPVVASKL